MFPIKSRAAGALAALLVAALGAWSLGNTPASSCTPEPVAATAAAAVVASATVAMLDAR